MNRDDVPYEMLFMDASDPVIIRRYKETRRRHPMAPSSRISEGIARERERLAPVRAKATYIIDTSELRKADLRDKIHRIFGTGEGEQMNINVLSFGFKFGMPLDADMVLDVRFLPNPFISNRCGIRAARCRRWRIISRSGRSRRSFCAILTG